MRGEEEGGYERDERKACSHQVQDEKDEDTS